MKRYGETIRKIRIERGLIQKEVYTSIVSRSFYARFERGQAEMTAPKFHDILKNLSLSFEEFLYIHHDYQPYLYTKHQLIDSYKENQEYEQLLSIYEQYRNSSYQSERSLALHAYVHYYISFRKKEDLDPTPVYQLKESILKRQHLTLHELNLAPHITSVFEGEEGLEIIDVLLEKAQDYASYDQGKYLDLLVLLYGGKIQHSLVINNVKQAQSALKKCRNRYRITPFKQTITIYGYDYLLF